MPQVSAPVPRRVEERAVRLDYGQFCLCGHPSPDADYMTLLEQAINGSGIAADDNGVIVISPHQNNFEMPFRLEVWDDPPPIGPGVRQPGLARLDHPRRQVAGAALVACRRHPRSSAQAVASTCRLSTSHDPGHV